MRTTSDFIEPGSVRDKPTNFLYIISSLSSENSSSIEFKSLRWWVKNSD
jgi:hypothetical protein